MKVEHAAPKEPRAAVPCKPAAKRYFEAVGRRKTSVARVRVTDGKGTITINNKDAAAYFPLPRLHAKVPAPIAVVGLSGKVNASVRVSGGGISSQAEAARLGVARALVKLNPAFKKRLRTEGFLTRDPRMVERKKYGLKKARRAPQWQKR